MKSVLLSLALVPLLLTGCVATGGGYYADNPGYPGYGPYVGGSTVVGVSVYDHGGGYHGGHNYNNNYHHYDNHSNHGSAVAHGGGHPGGHPSGGTHAVAHSGSSHGGHSAAASSGGMHHN